MSYLLLVVMMFAAMTGSPASAQDGITQGGRLTAIVNPEPPNLILGINQLGPTLITAGKIYQSLLDYSYDLEPQPRLAESWTVSEDGLTYTFKLRKDVRWHDGQPFTARDVVFTTAEMLPSTHPRARVIFARCESIEAPDDHTVVFKLKEPFAPFILAFDTTTSPIMPAHIYKGTDFASNPANQTPIGTGPFKFKEWKRGQYIHLVKNENYWRPGKPYLDEIYYRIIPDGSSRALALETGEVDLASTYDIEYVDIDRLRQLEAITVESKGWEMFAPHAFIELNNREKPFDDKRFRQAILYAWDRDFIRDNIWFGMGKVPVGPINSRTKFFDPAAAKLYPYDPAKSEALLDEMGLARGPDGVRARVRLLVLPYGDTWTRTAEYMAQALKNVGIEVTLETGDVAGWAQRTSNWDYQMTMNFPYQYGDPALGVARTYISSNIKKGILHSNTIGYVNPKVDELFDAAARELDPEKRQAHYSEIQTILTEDVPLAWFLELQFATIHNRKVRDVVTSAIGIHGDFDSVWIER